MPLNFPNNPTVGQTYQSGSSATYRFNSQRYWETVLPSTQVVNYPSVANWTSVGTIQSVGISATTTAPTVPTNHVTNAILYKQLGPKTHKVRGLLINAASTTGGANGNGDYLLTLPYGLQFDTTVPGQATYTANPAGQDSQFIQRSLMGSISILSVGGSITQGFLAGVIPWSATQYRIFAGIVTNNTYNWQSGYFSITQNSLIAEWEFEFQSL